MADRRKAHKLVHAPCPFGQFNWADCDEAAAHQWGKCIAIVGEREPTPCSRWAMDSDGYCFQHFVSERERVKREELAVATRADLYARIDAHLAWVAEHPSIHDSPNAPKMGRYAGGEIPHVVLAAGAGLEPATSRVTTDRSTSELPRKGPHRLTADEM